MLKTAATKPLQHDHAIGWEKTHRCNHPAYFPVEPLNSWRPLSVFLPLQQARGGEEPGLSRSLNGGSPRPAPSPITAGNSTSQSCPMPVDALLRHHAAATCEAGYTNRK